MTSPRGSADGSVAAPAYTQIVFDTDCVLCSGMVQFVLRNERAPTTQFIGAWSATGLEIAARHGLSKDDLERTYLVVEGGRGYTKSDAGIVVARHLRAPAHWLSMMRVLPRPLRDAVYDVVAKRRYRWFGHRACCFLPPPGFGDRFIDS